MFLSRKSWDSFLWWHRFKVIWLHSTAVTTELCEITPSRETSCSFIKLLLSSGWRFIGSLYNREIVPFGLWRVLITLSKLVFSSCVRTFNQYSLPSIRQYIQKVEYLKALQIVISQREYHFLLHPVKKNRKRMETNMYWGLLSSQSCVR